MGRVWSWSQVLLAHYPEQGCQGCDKAGLVHLSQGTSSQVWVADQLIFYHSVLLIYKVRLSQAPKYLYKMHNSWSYQYRTRQADSGLIKLMGKPRLELVKNSFKWRAAAQFNQLPQEIRKSENILDFKSKTKTWIKTNIPIN